MKLTRRGERVLLASACALGLGIGYILPDDPFHQVPDQVSANVYTIDELYPKVTLENEINPAHPVFTEPLKRYAYEGLFKRHVEREWVCLDNLWTQESQWDSNAQHAESTAYGIAQFIDQTWDLVGKEKTSDAHGQIDAGLLYIDKRYKGSPCLAWEHSQRKGFY